MDLFVAAGMCLASRCLAMDFRSGSTIPASRRHVTIYKLHETSSSGHVNHEMVISITLINKLLSPAHRFFETNCEASGILCLPFYILRSDCFVLCVWNRGRGLRAQVSYYGSLLLDSRRREQKFWIIFLSYFSVSLREFWYSILNLFFYEVCILLRVYNY
jgi:hypothetical protein